MKIRREKVKLPIELFFSVLLTFGLLSGLLLVQQTQEVRKKASGFSLWTIYNNAPIVRPGGGTESDNIYAPDVHKEGNVWKMWYGGQGTDLRDRIHYATSSDGINWEKHGVVLDNGRGHTNDPSVVKVGDTYYMYFTDAETIEANITDRIGLATSEDGEHWIKRGRVLDVGPRGSWDSEFVSRPSVIFENGIFKMWFDAANTSSYSRLLYGYATSTDGYHFTKYPDPVGDGLGAIDVKHVGNKYYLVDQGGDGTHMSIGDSETHFVPQGLIIPKSGGIDDAGVHWTPMIYVEDGQWTRTYFGGTLPQCCHARIFVALNNSCVVQGFKVVEPGGQKIEPAASQNVTLDGISSTSANVYVFQGVSSATGHTVSVSTPVGYTVGYTLCYNQIDCHSQTPVVGSSVGINCLAGGYVDLWWHYTQNLPPSPSPSPTPSPSPSLEYTVSYKIAESLEGLESVSYQAYSLVPQAASYTFGDLTPGDKNIFVRFRSNRGREVDTHLRIVYNPPQPSPSPTPSPSPSPTPSPSPSPSPSPTPSPSPSPTPSPSPSLTPSPTPPALGSLTLKVKFDGVSRQAPSQQVRVKLIPQTSSVSTSGVIQQDITVSSDARGIYSGVVTNVPLGSYIVFVKGPVHLQRRLGPVTVDHGGVTLDGSSLILFAGDLVGTDETIGLFDFNYVVDEYGRTSPARSDLNFDGVVDLFDFNIVVDNYGREGER